MIRFMSFNGIKLHSFEIDLIFRRFGKNSDLCRSEFTFTDFIREITPKIN